MKRVTLFMALFFLGSVMFAQNQEERPVVRPVQIFIGLQPSVSAEPFDEYRSAVNLNLIPLSIEYAINRHLSVRILPKMDIQFRPEFPSVISKVGLKFTVPYYFSLKNSEEGQRGFYAGPTIGMEMNRLNNYYLINGFAEAGYAFLFQNVLSISLGAMAGASIQYNPEVAFYWIVPRTGARITVGIWF
jgi:hypothetical protein